MYKSPVQNLNRKITELNGIVHQMNKSRKYYTEVTQNSPKEIQHAILVIPCSISSGKYTAWTKLRNQESKKKPWKGLGRRSYRHSVVDRRTMTGRTGQAIEGGVLSRAGQVELRRNREGRRINNTKDD